jgi:hypothetical protein
MSLMLNEDDLCLPTDHLDISRACHENCVKWRSLNAWKGVTVLEIVILELKIKGYEKGKGLELITVA